MTEPSSDNHFPSMAWLKEHGAALAEYGLLVALIAAACIVIVSVLGDEIRSLFQHYVDTYRQAIKS